MKRTLILLFSALLLCAAIPLHAVAETTEQAYDADHVLIYNPLPYVENGNALFTGTPQQEPPAQARGELPYQSGKHRTGKDNSNKTDGPETHAFWICTDLNTYAYDKCTFRLAAQGEHCSVWALENDSVSFSQEQLEAMAEQFETVIYPSDTEHFGPFRDLGGDGRVNILTYAMNSLSVCGFFDAYDLYTQEEIFTVDPDDPYSYNCLPIINVNARMAEQQTTVLCTLAHEFAHLILRSAVLASPANAGMLGRETTVGLWLNEGLSMAAEELSYPGAVAEQGYLDAFARSDRVRLGMSYANFDASGTDVGAYGQSFLFAQYLKAQCGDTVYRDLIDLWRSETENGNLNEAHMLDLLLNDAQKDALDALCTYTPRVRETLKGGEQELLSKFALRDPAGSGRGTVQHRRTACADAGVRGHVLAQTGGRRRAASGGERLVPRAEGRAERTGVCVLKGRRSHRRIHGAGAGGRVLRACDRARRTMACDRGGACRGRHPEGRCDRRAEWRQHCRGGL